MTDSAPTDLSTTATWAEIHSQPEVWTAWAMPLARQAKEIAEWIAARQIEEVWLCGAGTSAFIGAAIAAEAPARPRLIAAPTTDIVACPGSWIARPGRILAVQFGRSGDSSESVGLMDLLDTHRPDIATLHITCNAEGALASRPAPSRDARRVLSLPDGTHDRGFAMTASFTTMLLSALACLTGSAATTSHLPSLADQARLLLSHAGLRTLPRPERAIFLGAGALTAIARESALKVLELTAGRTVTQWDSPLGFRHGPKAAVDADTHVFLLLHPDPHCRAYDTDMAQEIAAQFPGTGLTTIGPGGDLPFDGTGDATRDAALSVLPAQVLAARWSADLGLRVDDPFQGRNLSRVVSGVTLYPWAGRAAS